jgi:AraC-like DNA-binding protein
MTELTVQEAIAKLGGNFSRMNWNFMDVAVNGRREKISQWLGDPDEDIMACVCSDRDTREVYHRQDFFFLNFAYQGDYDALSHRDDHAIVVREGECYIGQPFSGYAIQGSRDHAIKIIGVHIRKDIFFRDFLPALSSDSRLFRFFLEPETNAFSDQVIILDFGAARLFRATLEMICLEYAQRKADTQAILKPMVLALLMQIARQFKKSKAGPEKERLSDRIVQYMSEHTDTVRLKDIAEHFSYHPNYISSLLHREYGKTFSEILLQQRMERAQLLLKNTDLTVEEIAGMLGYAEPANFYKAFVRCHHGESPRKFMRGSGSAKNERKKEES